MRTNMVKRDQIRQSPTGFRWAQVPSNVVQNVNTRVVGDETHITINRNVVCEPHVDQNNSDY